MGIKCPPKLVPRLKTPLRNRDYVPPPDSARDAATFCLRLFLGQLVEKEKNLNEFVRPRRKQVEEAGMSALVWMLSDSVAKNLYLDGDTRELLLAFLCDKLPVKISVERSPGTPARVPEGAIRIALEEELAAGGNLESAYAAAKAQLGVCRSRAQQVARKHSLKAGATKGG